MSAAPHCSIADIAVLANLAILDIVAVFAIVAILANLAMTADPMSEDIKKASGLLWSPEAEGGGDLLSRFRSTIGAAGFNFSVRNG